MAKKLIDKLTFQDVDTFERLKYQFKELHEDISTLSKKSPDAPINKFKLTFINEKLAEANALLSDSFKPSLNFSLFQEDNLPSNSDVLMILSQYLDALEAWRSAHVKNVGYHDWCWETTDGSEIETTEPSRYRSKR